MMVSLDISDDFANVTDGLQLVDINGTTVNALRRAIGTHELKPSGGKYLSSDVVFHLDAAEFVDDPAIGTAINDTDGAWTILSVHRQTLNHRWRCVCRKLYIDPGNTVEIQLASYTKSDTGAQEPNWTTVASDVVALVHYRSEQIDVANDARHTVKKAYVYFTSNQQLSANHRIIAPDETVLNVVSWNNFDELAQYFTATCAISKWPLA